MSYKEIINKVSQELGLSEKLVESTYRSFFLFIRGNITKLPLKDELSKEDFSNLRTNFNIPSLGKLTCSYDNFCRTKKRFKYIKHIKNKYNDEFKEN